MAKQKFRAVATVGTYTNRDGVEKKRYHRVGTAFKDDDGSFSLKLESIPVGSPSWVGWVSFYPEEEGGYQQKQQSAPAKPVFEEDVQF